jgi:hypothetical protein
MSNENLEKLEKLENVTYPDWDNVIVQLCQGEKGIANIKMQRQDIEAIQALHGSERTEVIEMMFQALEEQVKQSGPTQED